MCPTPDGRGLAGGSPEHWEDETSLGALGEVAEEGGINPDIFRKVILSSVPSVAYFGGVKMGLDGNYTEKTGGDTSGFLEAGGGDVGA